MRREIRSLVFHTLLFLGCILYWECLMQLVAFGTLRQMQGWFLLFALPQALFPAAFCGWKRERAGRLFAALPALLLGVFYCAHMIYFRIFGSVISLSMVGVGGAAVRDFGWALRATLRESAGWIALFALPVAAMFARLFRCRAAGGRVRLMLRVSALLTAATLWMIGGMLLLLGGSGESSAYRAYTSAFTDTDTAAQKLGVLTSSELEAASMLFGRAEADETAEAVGAVVAAEQPAALPTPEPTAAPPRESGAETPAETAAPRGTDRSPQIFDEIDFAALADKSTDPTVRSLCEYFGSLPGTERNAYTGLLEGCNLVVVCAEGFSTLSLSEELTPTLWRMAHEGVVLTNFYNSFKNTTTNGEFALLTGLWPDLSRKADFGETNGSFSQSAGHYMPYGLGNLFRAQGVKSYMFHNYRGDYYGRSRSHANLGYVCRFSDTMDLSITWPASDLEMMQQTVDDFIGEERFNVYYMTFSGHGPYNIHDNPLIARNFSRVPEKIDGKERNVLARCFYASDLELEWSMEYLLQRLEEAGKRDNTLIVVVGDHYPYYLSDGAAYSILGGQQERNFERYHSTCILWCGGIDEPIVCDAPCCNVDILPTVLNLLGIEFDSRLLAGTDVFADAPHTAVLSNKSFITSVLKYNALSGDSTVLDKSVFPDRPSRRAYIESVNRDIMARYAASLAVNKTDFYRFVWENSGLMEPGT